MSRSIGILLVSNFTYSSKEELVKKLRELKQTMLTTADTGDSVLATATAYNIVHLTGELRRIERQEQQHRDMPRTKIKIRTEAQCGLQGMKNPNDALKAILKEIDA